MALHRTLRRAGHLITGREAETRARRFLERRGLTFIEANYRCRVGEIDLIMREQTTIVFVEVRYRRSQSHGGARQSIDRRKQRRLRATAEHYLQRRRGGTNVPCRFDVVLISGAGGPADAPDREAGIDWVANAL